jgi:hypothetical protein
LELSLRSASVGWEEARMRVHLIVSLLLFVVAESVSAQTLSECDTNEFKILSMDAGTNG